MINNYEEISVADHYARLNIPRNLQITYARGKTKKAILPTFALGNINLNNVSVGFFEGAIGRQKMSIIGGDVLKRLNIIIDAKREFIYLKSNKLKNLAYSNV
ncbi:MAG: hypothetical protein EOO93_19100 [Pedobacter sp.]|nr:MAG: hypothetical protein EOO93_19100 [Pedobacter sp.]